MKKLLVWDGWGGSTRFEKRFRFNINVKQDFDGHRIAMAFLRLTLKQDGILVKV